MLPSSSIFRADAARGHAHVLLASRPPRRSTGRSVEGCPFYVGASQFEYWAFFQISVDVTAGGGDSFSIEAPEGSAASSAHALSPMRKPRNLTLRDRQPTSMRRLNPAVKPPTPLERLAAVQH
jgi:uncharacterized protein DUF779